MDESSVAVSRHTCAGSSEGSFSQLPDLDCRWAGISMGVPVSNPLRACERYHAAWLSLKADLGNCVLTVAISSSLVMTLFAVMASITTCLMVRLDSGLSILGTEDSATTALPLGEWVLVFCSFLIFHLFSPYQPRSRVIAAPRALICRELSVKPRRKREKTMAAGRKKSGEEEEYGVGGYGMRGFTPFRNLAREDLFGFYPNPVFSAPFEKNQGRSRLPDRSLYQRQYY